MKRCSLSLIRSTVPQSRQWMLIGRPVRTTPMIGSPWIGRQQPANW
jgi:hypothetical protein